MRNYAESIKQETESMWAALLPFLDEASEREKQMLRIKLDSYCKNVIIDTHNYAGEMLSELRSKLS